MEIKKQIGHNFGALHDMLYRTSLKRGLGQQDAEDLTMETFLKALTAGETNSSLEPWLQKIRKNEQIDKYSSKKLENRQIFVELDENQTDSNVSVEETIQFKLNLEEGLKILEKLTPRQQKIIILRAFELSYSEITKLTGTNEIVLRVDHARGLKKLKELRTQGNI